MVVAAPAVAATATVAEVVVVAAAAVGQHCNPPRRSCTRAHCTRSRSSCRRSNGRGSPGRTKAVMVVVMVVAAVMSWCSCACCSSHQMCSRHSHGGSLTGSLKNSQLTSTCGRCLQLHLHRFPTSPVPRTPCCMRDVAQCQVAVRARRSSHCSETLGRACSFGWSSLGQPMLRPASRHHKSPSESGCSCLERPRATPSKARRQRSGWQDRHK